MKHICALSIFMLLLPINSKGQSDSLQLSLQEAIEYAMTHAYEKVNADYDVEGAQKRLWESIALGLPQVSGSAGYNHNPDLPVSLFPVEILPPDMRPPGSQPGDKVPISFAQAYDANYSISVNQLIFDGSYIVGLKAASVFKTLRQQQRDKTSIEVRNMVTQAYYLALTARENVTTFKRSLAVNERTLKETRAYFKNGFREETDVVQIELMMSNSKSRLLEVERSYKVALAVLKFSMGMDLTQSFILTEKMESILAPTLLKHDNPAFNVENHIDYKLADSDVSTKKLLMRLEQSQYLPKIEANYTYSKYAFGDEWNIFDQDWFPSQVIGLNLSIPIFTSGSRAAKVKQEKLNYLKAQNTRTMVTENLTKDFLNANTTLSTKREQFANSLKNKELATRIYDLSLIKFQKGLINSTELSQNESQYIEAELRYIESTLALLQAHIELQKILSQL
ncbi:MULTISPECIES: TolC family protein [unclassified Carboxylicivirga]|uniref:TolC family protein n=1 Tax=Carboxylicivirga TaxID=1628153 RepID=UPI003D335283